MRDNIYIKTWKTRGVNQVGFKSSKFKHPFAKISFHSFEEAMANAIMLPEIKNKAMFPGGVKIFHVHGLAKSSWITEIVVDKNTINTYEPSDIGQQIGYRLVGKSAEDRIKSLSLWQNPVDLNGRGYITDLGINTEHRYNKHLAFRTMAEAIAYVNYHKNSKKEIKEREQFLSGWGWTDFCDPCDYPEYDNSFYDDDEEQFYED